jgi:hypothetical protein
MNDRVQRRPPLPDRLTTAERDFCVELRRLVDIAGMSFRALEETTAAKPGSGETDFYSKSQWGRWLNGRSRPPRKAVRKLADALARDDIEAGHLVGLWDAAFASVPDNDSLPAQPDYPPVADFLTRYLKHVTEYHGMLEPPDFECRRRIPVDDLYVRPAIVQVAPGSPQLPPRQLTLGQFGKEIGRAVLLGDPGGGKTTAAQVLMHSAAQAGSPVPFMVTLREFAAQTAVPRSVAGYLQDRLEAFYQCPAPAGTVEQFLASGTALVIFDGLDELPDAARRAEVTAIIERFCSEYPAARVLVTSRLLGYDQARLDDRLFTRYRLGGFDDQQVAEYVGKWFAQEEGLDPAAAAGRAAAFLAESEGVPDLRANPLMLALMCVSYQGEGSIPRNRPEVYAQCTTLLFRRWDAHRNIDVQLRARSQAEAAVRHLAYWVFTRGAEQPTVTESELLRETSAFLYDHGFEAGDHTAEAAREFIMFCRNRAWAFSDLGTTADGQRLYTFTHRTFLEYFAAAHLATAWDSPEELARALAPHIARQEWEVVAELAVQIKSGNSDRGAQRVYVTLLGNSGITVQERSHTLQFLARCVRFLEPPPRTVRELTTAALDHLFGGDISDEVAYLPLSWLLASCASCCDTVRDVLAARIMDMLPSPDPETHLNGLRLAIWASRGAVFHRNGRIVVPAKAPEHLARFWDEFATQNAKSHAEDIVKAAARDEGMLYASLRYRFRTVGDILTAPGQDLTPLLTAPHSVIFDIWWLGYLEYLAGAATRAWGRAVHSGLPRASAQDMREDFTAVGQYLISHPEPPWLAIYVPSRYEPVGFFNTDFADPPAFFKTTDPVTYLGTAATVLILAEMARDRTLPAGGDPPLGSFCDLYPYILRRWDYEPNAKLPELPVPERFQRLFKAWAVKDADFVASPADAARG